VKPEAETEAEITGILMGTVATAVRVALGSLAANKLRSLLTLIGVMISVAAVMTVLSGTQASTDAVVKAMGDGTGMLDVRPGFTTASARVRTKPFLTTQDAHTIAREAVHVRAVMPYVEQDGVLVINGERNANTTLVAIGGQYFGMANVSFGRGESWSELDDAARSNVVVLGAATARRLFGKEDPIARLVRIGRVQVRVVGVLAPSGEEDDRLYAPLTFVRARILPARDGRVDAIHVKPHSLAEAAAARDEIHKIVNRPGRGYDRIFVGSQDDYLRGRLETIATLSLLFLTVACVSLVVGGVGVMNIMLVSVAERTREIGIRISIGADGRDILLQYLVESVTLTVIGGVLGIVLGIGGSGLLADALQIEVRYSIGSAVAGFGTSVGIGIVFGFFPALSAARLDPIEALRTE
jgi:putative ABC transport system permease protein